MMLSQTDIRAYVRFAGDVATEAGALLKRGFNRSARGRVTYKGRINPVTEYDVKSERYIASRIRRRFPGHALLAEEGSSAKERSQFRWIVDPLDGTVNYAHGFPIYCVSIALEYDGVIVVGVVYDPERDELFSAGRGISVFLNGRKITVSVETSLRRSLLATGFGYNVSTVKRNNLGLFARMVKTAQAVRRPGSAAIDLCWLACGRLDGFWEFYLHPWDTAAGWLIVEEAGGKVTRLSGRPYAISAVDILATNGRIHKAMMAALSGRSRKN
ncbi:MAG TPA: inositol monophosphatase family protein [Candidatus Deferrimicrobium sp.]|nr:inositol monophosphatase family protein [Candidatus Deferrimicrobium sp.]